jgi:transcriptional antiterminator NusG
MLLAVLLFATSAEAFLLGPRVLSPAVAHERAAISHLRLAADAEIEFAFSEDDDENLEADAEQEAERVRKLVLPEKPAGNMTVAELKNTLRQLGLRHTGSRPALLERLQNVQRKHALGLPINEMEVQTDRGEMRWYMLQTANGFERAVETKLNMMVSANNMQDTIERVFVPVLEGETSVRESSVMPSYIFLRMRMSPDIHFIVSDLQYVVSFVGADRGGRSMSGQMVGNRGFVRPLPMSDEAFERVVALTRAHHTPEEASESAPPEFAPDELVTVTEGPFQGLVGRVLELRKSEETLSIELTIMGRPTPCSVKTSHCRKEAEAEAGGFEALGSETEPNV